MGGAEEARVRQEARQWAHGADTAAFFVLFGFLGWVAAQVVTYQYNHQEEYCACFTPTCEENDGDSWSQATRICGNGDKPCPHPDELPAENLLYAAAFAHTGFIIAHAVLQYFSRSASKQEISRTRNTFSLCLTNAFPGGTAAEQDIVPDDFDIPSMCAGIACIVGIVGGIGLVYVPDTITMGMMITVLSARLLAYVMTLHIQTDAATDLATFQFIERIAKMALWSDKLNEPQQQEIIVRIRKLEESGATKMLIFCGTKRSCEDLCNQLRQYRFLCASIHGDKEQPAREKALWNLKTKPRFILVATDVAAREIGRAHV